RARAIVALRRGECRDRLHREIHRDGARCGHEVLLPISRRRGGERRRLVPHRVRAGRSLRRAHGVHGRRGLEVEALSAPRGYRARMQAYREWQPVREEREPAGGDPRSAGTGRFYRAYPWGANVELIVVDDRSYRDPHLPGSEDAQAASCARTMLGAVQLRWLEDALAAAKRRGA